VCLFRVSTSGVFGVEFSVLNWVVKVGMFRVLGCGM
jgi:hypothetical protein